MKNYTSSKTMMAVLLGLMAGATVASAQIPSVNVSVAGLGSASGGAVSAGGATTGAFGGSASSAGAGSMRGGFDGSAPAARLDAFESIGMRQERLAREAAGASMVTSQTSTSVTPVPNHAAASTILRAGFSADTIRSANVEERQQLTTNIDKRVETSAEALATLKHEGKPLEGQAKADFKTAMKDVDAREKELKASMKTARKASAEAWADNRAEVAARYEAYTEAVARAENAAKAPTAMSSEVNSATSAKAAL
jgi:hypothetical protein